MQNENLVPLMQKPSRISTTQQVANTHVIQIYEDIGHPDEYRDELNLINTSTEMDTIVLDICTDGGVLDTAMLFKRALFNTPAHTVAIIGPACSSAGSILALSCEEHILDDTSNLMIHTSTYGLVAKDTDIYEHANFSRKQLRKLYEDVYSGFLSEADLEDVIKGTPFYFDADQLAERLENMYEYRRANQQNGCGNPECEECALEDEEPFDLMQEIDNRVAQGVEKALDKILKKYTLTEKPKPVRKAKEQSEKVTLPEPPHVEYVKKSKNRS